MLEKEDFEIDGLDFMVRFSIISQFVCLHLLFFQYCCLCMCLWGPVSVGGQTALPQPENEGAGPSLRRLALRHSRYRLISHSKNVRVCTCSQHCIHYWNKWRYHWCTLSLPDMETAVMTQLQSTILERSASLYKVGVFHLALLGPIDWRFSVLMCSGEEPSRYSFSIW